MVIFENIYINIKKAILKIIHSDINKATLKNIAFDKTILKDIDINIDKILNQLEFGILNRANDDANVENDDRQIWGGSRLLTLLIFPQTKYHKMLPFVRGFVNVKR